MRKYYAEVLRVGDPSYAEFWFVGDPSYAEVLRVVRQRRSLSQCKFPCELRSNGYWPYVFSQVG